MTKQNYNGGIKNMSSKLGQFNLRTNKEKLINKEQMTGNKTKGDDKNKSTK